MDDTALLRRQAELQAEARAFVERLGLLPLLGSVGRVVPLGSAVTGLMVWHDLDFGVDATGLTADGAWEALRPLLPCCTALHYLHEPEGSRHYYVMRIDGWKVDLSVWTAGLPPEVEEFQRRLIGRLSDLSRLTLLRLKSAWCTSPAYPETVSAWQIYDAVLEHGVETLAELDRYLAARGYPTRAAAAGAV